MLTMLGRSNPQILIEKSRRGPGQRSAPVWPKSWSSFGACIHPHWEVALNVRAGQAQNAVRGRYSGEISEAFRTVHSSMVALDEAAAGVMAEIIAVPAAQGRE